MKKMNKKGFTLIEMLVVIAIIAVLVAIIVPTVSNSTLKAKAATDAANLRSVQAEAQIAVLNANLELPASGTTTDVKSYAPSADTMVCKTNKDWTLSITMDDAGTVTAKYSTYGVDEFSKVADGTDKNGVDVAGNG